MQHQVPAQGGEGFSWAPHGLQHFAARGPGLLFLLQQLLVRSDGDGPVDAVQGLCLAVQHQQAFRDLVEGLALGGGQRNGIGDRQRPGTMGQSLVRPSFQVLQDAQVLGEGHDPPIVAVRFEDGQTLFVTATCLLVAAQALVHHAQVVQHTALPEGLTLPCVDHACTVHHRQGLQVIALLLVQHADAVQGMGIEQAVPAVGTMPKGMNEMLHGQIVQIEAVQGSTDPHFQPAELDRVLQALPDGERLTEFGEGGITLTELRMDAAEGGVDVGLLLQVLLALGHAQGLLVVMAAAVQVQQVEMGLTLKLQGIHFGVVGPRGPGFLQQLPGFLQHAVGG